MENRLSQQGPQAARKPIRVDFRRSRDEVRRWRHARLDCTRLREHQPLQTILAGKIKNFVSERSKILKFLADKLTSADISEAQRRARVCMASNYQDCDWGTTAMTPRQAGQTGVGGFHGSGCQGRGNELLPTFFRNATDQKQIVSGRLTSAGL